MSLFADDPEVIRIGVEFLKVNGLLLPVFFLNFSMNSLMQALKRPAMTLFVTIYRDTFAVWFFIGVFVLALGFETLGVWLGVATSAVTACLLAIFITTKIARKEIGGLLRA